MADADTKEMAQSARKYWSAEGYTEGGVIREVDYSTQSGGLDPMFEGIKIVDTDTHIIEAPDLFTSRAPAALKDKVPFVKLDAETRTLRNHDTAIVVELDVRRDQVGIENRAFTRRRGFLEETVRYRRVDVNLLRDHDRRLGT